ncbi:putative NmrA-like family domain-containing protein 1 [Rhexocercosporidium sp. MPI-PUGE-AT-0058]|nr:putative NmrA-like family domain-containing protein 1 [Rhexocercosporidium sp. MPI-PUGE-AT-0058]
MASKTFLIVGATGTQGSSVVKALLADPSLPSDAHILALTRNASSSKAKSLAALDSRVEPLSGDPTAPDAIFRNSPYPIDAVFCVTVHGPAGSEEAQADGLIKASLENNVKHFVFTSADRGGEKFSDTNATPVPHIATKHRIELHLRGMAEGTEMKWTILRPVTFMDNLTPDFAGKGFTAMWNQVGSKPIQLVAASDIGYFAAKALLNRDQYAGKKIGIAGDELNYEQACKVFKEHMGVEMPTTFCAVGTLVKFAMKDLGAMFQWFEKDGYAVDIAAARKEYPGLQDFGTWLEKSSSFKKA